MANATDLKSVIVRVRVPPCRPYIRVWSNSKTTVSKTVNRGATPRTFAKCSLLVMFTFARSWLLLYCNLGEKPIERARGSSDADS